MLPQFDHDDIAKVLAVLSDAGRPLLPLEYMYACYDVGIRFDSWLHAVKGLKEAGVIRARGVGDQINAYFLAETLPTIEAE